jgi:pimeloyl-ACP methyl ester carboxylesterase
LKAKLERYHGNKTEALFWAWTQTWTNENFRNWSIENFLPLINCPSLIIQGENDEFGSLEQVEKTIMQTTGHSTKLVLTNIGHNPHKEIPELIIEKSTEFINRVLGK